MEQAAQVLFQYLKDVLYAPDQASLDVDALPPELRQLGYGVRFLGGCVVEQRTFLRALAKGDLAAVPPSADNVLAAPAKELQGSLRHLTWQTQQVAKGDYNQKVDFMGEFSTAFNTMTEQLKLRTANLIHEKEQTEQRNLELSRNLELVLALTNHTHNMIFVFSTATGQEIFVNQPARWFVTASPQAASLLRESLTQRQLDGGAASQLWEAELTFRDGGMRAYYGVESFLITWGGETAAVHIVVDDTERRRREDLANSLAYTDPLTGLCNRRYAVDRMNKLQKSSTPYLLSFIDIDYLKYCNDNYGHTSGDHYLQEVAHILQTLGGDLCRVGGDEFILLQEGTDGEEQDRRLSQLRDLLREQSVGSPYPKSFSFATTAVPAGAQRGADAYLQETDIKMYHYKRTHKRPLFEIYHDDRLGPASGTEG